MDAGASPGPVRVRTGSFLQWLDVSVVGEWSTCLEPVRPVFVRDREQTAGPCWDKVGTDLPIVYNHTLHINHAGSYRL